MQQGVNPSLKTSGKYFKDTGKLNIKLKKLENDFIELELTCTRERRQPEGNSPKPHVASFAHKA